MDKSEIEQIIKKGEGLKVEFKQARSSVPSDMFETIVSFSNTEGGYLFLGVQDDGVITGIDEEHINKILKNIVSSINSIDCINPPLYLQPTPVEIDGKWIIKIYIPVSSQVHNHKGHIYIREFESDIDITGHQQRISDLHLVKRNVFTESEIIPNLGMDDLDKALFDKARNLIRSNRSDHPWLSIDDLSILKEAVLWRKDFITGKEGLTLAAALIFGKDSTIQSILTAYKVEAMLRKENTDRWDDRLTLRTNLIDTYIELKSFINKHLPEKFYMEGHQRIDLRDKVFREVIANIIVHREYSSALATEVIIDNFQFTATNANKAHFSGPIDLDSFNPYPKNPNIRKFFTAIGWADEIGSGIRNTKKYLPLYVNGTSPIFIEGNIFKTVIPLNYVSLKDYSKEWVNWLDLSKEYENHIALSLEKIQINSDLFKADWETCILNLVPSWTEKGTKLNVLDWPKNQPVTENDIKKVPSWSEKGTKLLHKKVYYIICILSLTAEALSMDDIMKAIGYSNKKTFRDNYIKPLEQLRFISKTDIENPTSPDQKYILLNEGALFLGNVLAI